MRAFELATEAPWAITEQGLRTVLEVAQRKNASPEAVAAAMGRDLDNTRSVTVRDGVAIIPVTGPLFRYANLFTRLSGATSYEVLALDFSSALESAEVRAIVLVIDSPGGMVNGCQELADMIYAARGAKPVWAYVDGMAASGGYWIASAADRVVCAPSAMLGSIGVIASFTDTTKADEKAGLREIEIISSVSPKKAPDPADEAGRAQIQVVIDELGELFVASVARNRGRTREEVLAFGAGDVRVGATAVEAGLADSLGSFEGVLTELARSTATSPLTGLFAAGAAGGSPGTSTKETSMSGQTQPGPAADQPVITKATLEQSHASVVAEIRADGAAAERARILGIEELVMAGYEELAASSKRDGAITPEAFAAAQIREQQKKLAAARAAVGTDVPTPPAPAASADDVARETTDAVSADPMKPNAKNVQQILSAGTTPAK